MGDVNKLFVFKTLLATFSNVMPSQFTPQANFPTQYSIFTEDKGDDGIESRLPSKIFSTLQQHDDNNYEPISYEAALSCAQPKKTSLF